MTRARADLLLLLVAIIWGTAFVAQKRANDAMGPISFVGLRFLLSWIAVAPLAFYENKKQLTRLNMGDLVLACLIGFCLFAGASLQQIGLVTTTATNGGFLTALYVIFVPLIAWATTGRKPTRFVLAAGAISVTGAWFLTEQGQLQRFTSGDACILLADLAWAGAISLIPVFLSRAPRPFFLAFSQYGVAAGLGLVGGLGLEPLSKEGLTEALPSLLYAGFCSGGIAYTLQIFAQRHTPPAEAALIMSLESVFAAITGALLLSERMTIAAVFGSVLILLSAILVEAGPTMQNRMRQKTLTAPKEPRCTP